MGATFIAAVGEKGKITLPAPVRQALDIRPKDKLVIRLEQGKALIAGKLPTVAETAGIVTPLDPPKHWEEIKAIVQEEVAHRYQAKFHP